MAGEKSSINTTRKSTSDTLSNEPKTNTIHWP